MQKCLSRNELFKPDVIKRMLTARGYVMNPSAEKAVDGFIAERELFLHGGYGTGKSSLWYHLSQLKSSGGHERYGLKYESLNNKFLFPIRVCSISLAARQTPEALDRWLKSVNKGEVVLDDVGDESEQVSYGMHGEIVKYVMTLWQFSNWRLHVTTNLSGEDIGRRYGDRCVDRLHDLMSVNFGMESHRSSDYPRLKMTPNAGYNLFGIVSEDENTAYEMSYAKQRLDYELYSDFVRTKHEIDSLAETERNKRLAEIAEDVRIAIQCRI